MEFSGGPDEESSTIIHNTLQIVLSSSDGQMKLWAKLLVGESVIFNMRSPALKYDLTDLANEGRFGNTTTFRGVQFEFIRHSAGSKTTTPVESLG
ncbi:hypothetical protein MMC09_006837 [Bachmanniomyces sp. S44760]|nr:hypothetical protein [Bachmanniomyces sp. S44760]